MKKSDLLKQNRAALEAGIKPLLEATELTVEQKSLFDTKTAEIETLNGEISREEKREAMLLNITGASGRNIGEKEKKEISNYSFQRAIRMLCDHKEVDGLEGEMHEEGKREFSSVGKETKGFAIPLLVLNSRSSIGQNVTTAVDGGNLVQVDPFIFIESLKNALVLTQAGATFLTGLVGNLPLVKGGSFTASWIAEGDAVSFTKEAFLKTTMTPKNLMVAGAISKQLLVQNAGIGELLIRDEIIKAIAIGLEAAAISGAGTPAPTGILSTSGIGAVVGGTDGLAPAWGHIVDLESKITVANVPGQIAYLTNSKVVGKLKQTLKASNVSGYILENGVSNGCKVYATNAVPSTLTKGSSTSVCSAIIAGVFSELFIGMWGGLDMIVDPYTRADYNEVKIILNQFADVALRNAAGFAAMKDALTA